MIFSKKEKELIKKYGDKAYTSIGLTRAFDKGPFGKKKTVAKKMGKKILGVAKKNKDGHYPSPNAKGM